VNCHFVAKNALPHLKHKNLSPLTCELKLFLDSFSLFRISWRYLACFK